MKPPRPKYPSLVAVKAKPKKPTKKAKPTEKPKPYEIPESSRVVWSCSICLKKMSSRPAFERTLLYPGCGGSCGFQFRICAKCKIPGEQELAELIKNTHQQFHKTFRPIPDGTPQIAPTEKKQ